MTQEPWDEAMSKGVKFIGSDGWIEITREFYKSSVAGLVPEKKNENGPYETAVPHLANFIEAVRNRKDPVVPVETGHRTCTVCNLGNIAYFTGKVVNWDPVKQKFINSPEAEKYFHREYRKGYSL